MAVTAAPDSAADERLARAEESLARAAAAGDGQAFAALYERYESRAYNLAYRVTGSADDAADATQDAFVNVMKRLPKLGDREELNFGAYLLTATRNACYDLMRKQQRSQPTDEIPETAAPVGSGGSGAFDPGDPDEDPDRNVIVKAQQDEIREANSRLPERQREALALFELEEMSYDEVAEIMEMNRNSVAQLISRARIKLRDELRGTALASIAPSSPECERALPLIALADDGQVDAGSEEAGWLDAHVADCETCRLSREAMQEAGRSYRAWAPVAATPLLFRETMAKAAEAVGADWSDVIAQREAAHAAAGGAGASAGSGEGTSLAARLRRHRGRDSLIAAGLAAILLVVGFEAATKDPTPLEPKAIVPAADTAITPLPHKKKKAKKVAAGDSNAGEPTDATPTANGGFTPSGQTGGGDTGNSGGGGGGGNTSPGGGDTPSSTPPADPPAQVDEPPVVNDPTPPPAQPCRPTAGGPPC